MQYIYEIIARGPNNLADKKLYISKGIYECIQAGVITTLVHT